MNKLKMNKLKFPLYTALVTPLLETGQVDYECYKSLLLEQQEAGLGVLVLGSTGEALNLSLSQRKEIIKFVSTLNLNIPVMVGVGGADLEACLEWIDFLNDFELSSFFNSYLLVTPLYAKPGDHGQQKWFEALLDRSTRKCVLYNVPGRTASSLSLEAIKSLNDHSNFWGIKEASGSLAKFKEYRDIASEKYLFCGDDALCPEFCQANAQGLISVASNIWPKPCLEYVRLCLSKKLNPQDIKLWFDASSSLFLSSNPIPVKVLMHQKGKIKSPKLKLPLCSEDFNFERDGKLIMDSHEQVTKWFQQQS